jgi:antitoxin component HigA of HigAB toxin-antitoxin module
MTTTIDSDPQHAEALARVLVLMQSNPTIDSPEGQELDRLAEQIEAYEMRRWPL